MIRTFSDRAFWRNEIAGQALLYPAVLVVACIGLIVTFMTVMVLKWKTANHSSARAIVPTCENVCRFGASSDDALPIGGKWGQAGGQAAFHDKPALKSNASWGERLMGGTSRGRVSIFNIWHCGYCALEGDSDSRLLLG